ncbi:MAG: preprotein translocase subunit SecY [Treponema sp.]|nr:preprotein translocase subunit SecY [Treponema sp.]
MASNAIVNMFRVKELRGRLFFTLLILAVFRMGSVITIPGIDANVLFNYFEAQAQTQSNAFASYMDFFVGGAFSHFSVFMLGVMPYISMQIIMQLAVIIFPSLKRISQEDGGQRKIASYIRMGTIFVCIIQAWGVTVWADSIGCITLENHAAFKALAILTVTTGSMITIWFGDQITARGIGNGISMMIFAGIVARLPSAVSKLYQAVKNGEPRFVFVIIVLIMFIAIIALVIYEESGQRKIPVHYAKRVVGRKMYGGQSTYIPFKVNPSNVIPLIFANSLLTLPLTIIETFSKNAGAKPWVSTLARVLTPNGFWYNVLLVVLIIFFAYFYTQVTLNPTEIAKNIRENGGSIPGVRTDKTEEYLTKILNRLILPGSLFLAIIAVVPQVITNIFGFPAEVSALMGGTSLIIMIGVDLDTMSQVEALLKMHHHEGLTKKGKIRSRSL